MFPHPLIVDLDGTLIHTDMLHESAISILRKNIFYAFLFLFWLIKGKAVLKKHLASRIDFNPKLLPYNKELLEWLRQQKQMGRKLILCSASDKALVTTIADYLNIFDEVISSEGLINLSGDHKATALKQRFGHGGFDYVGNSNVDIAVWRCSRQAIVVNASKKLIKKAGNFCSIERIFPAKKHSLSLWHKVLRTHQWLKNLLLFVPFFATHQLTNVNSWMALLVAFMSFNLCASAVYIMNDLIDLESDRLHPRKRARPFASGQVPVWVGIFIAPVLLLIGLGMSSLVGGAFSSWLLFYFILTCVYSLKLKRLVLVDCLTLALLYTLRIIAGASAVENNLSFWLLAFSVFLFLSLSFLKRYAELTMHLKTSTKDKLHGRAYYNTDAPLIQNFGVTSGYAAIVVLSLYLNSEAVLALYKTPECIWGAVPVMLFWISWMWLQAQRGRMHDDPLIFAVKDKASLVAGLLFLSILAIGATGTF